MSIISFLNPYTYVAGAVVIASIGGGFYYQSREIHHYHNLYNADEVTIALKDATIKEMTTAQNDQLLKTDSNIVSLLQPPAKIQTVIKEIESQPINKDCVAPVDSKEIQDAF